jgi:hypothetical protein
MAGSGEGTGTTGTTSLGVGATTTCDAMPADPIRCSWGQQVRSVAGHAPLRAGHHISDDNPCRIVPFIMYGGRPSDLAISQIPP